MKILVSAGHGIVRRTYLDLLSQVNQVLNVPGCVQSMLSESVLATQLLLDLVEILTRYPLIEEK